MPRSTTTASSGIAAFAANVSQSWPLEAVPQRLDGIG
jgi:hypothetical protein